MKTNWIAIGAGSAGLAVLLGAFGAHGLKDRVSPADLELWKTAVLYHAIHALALVLFGLFRQGRLRGSAPGWTFLLGSLFFSGSLYAYALGGPRMLVHLTPIGGLSFVAGWILFAVAALRRHG